MALSYGIGVIGVAFQVIDAIGFNRDELNNWATSYFGSNPTLLGRVMCVIAVAVAIARLRSIMGWGTR